MELTKKNTSFPIDRRFNCLLQKESHAGKSHKGKKIFCPCNRYVVKSKQEK